MTTDDSGQNAIDVRVYERPAALFELAEGDLISLMAAAIYAANTDECGGNDYKCSAVDDAIEIRRLVKLGLD